MKQMTMRILTVELGNRSYPIYIGKSLLTNAEIVQRHLVADQVMIVTNETVGKLYLQQLKPLFKTQQCDVVILPDGEQHKNLDTLNAVFDALLTYKHRRNTTLIALGGGVVCDMTGFAAACYQRGVAFLQIPTSLLAQVDASIGGKTAVNHPLGKNMIGAFHQPRAVIIDTGLLATLPERELYAGLAEVIKTALIQDAEFFTWLEKNMTRLVHRDDEALAMAIERSCAIKAKIVAEDEYEISGKRALLNLGHTFGHAIEQVMGYGSWLHGEAVATGMVLAAKLSQDMGWLAEQDVERVKNILLAAHLPIRLPESIQYDKMLAAMAVDKKLQSSQLKFVLLKALGDAQLVSNIDAAKVRQVLEAN